MQNPIDPAQITIERTKATALRELRPYLSDYHRKSLLHRYGRVPARLTEAIGAYVEQIARVRTEVLVSETFLPAPEEFDPGKVIDEAIDEAIQFAGHELVTKLADRERDELVDKCRERYLCELDIRLKRWQACPISTVVQYDPEEEERIRADWAAHRAARESQDQGTQPRSQATDNIPTVAGEPAQPQPANVATTDFAERTRAVETCRSGTAGQKAEEASPGKERKGDVTLIDGKPAVTFRTAEAYLGISERQRQNLVRAGILKIEGQGQNRKITTESLKVYLPPENPN